MRVAPAQQRAFTYKVTTAPAGSPVSLVNVKLQLKITNGDDDDLLQIYIDGATDYGERLTRRDFITRTYKTFRDAFPGISEGYYAFHNLPQSGLVTNFGGNIGFELRKSPLQSVTSVKYLLNDALTTVDNTDYYNTLEEDYSELLIKDGKTWPDDADVRLQVIEIVFLAGLGDDDTEMPKWVTNALMQHVAALYWNRGDCSEGDLKNNLPPAARMLYIQNRIENL